MRQPLALLLGLRLHLLCNLRGLPVGFAITGAKADRRQVLLDILPSPALTAGRDGQIIITDKNYYGPDFEAILAEYARHYNGRRPPRSRQLRPPRPGHLAAGLSPQPVKRQAIPGGLIHQDQQPA